MVFVLISVEKDIHDRDVAVPGRAMERRTVVTFGMPQGVCAVVQQQPRRVDPALQAGDVQRRTVSPISFFYICTPRQE